MTHLWHNSSGPSKALCGDGDGGLDMTHHIPHVTCRRCLEAHGRSIPDPLRDRVAQLEATLQVQAVETFHAYGADYRCCGCLVRVDTLPVSAEDHAKVPHKKYCNFKLAQAALNTPVSDWLAGQLAAAKAEGAEMAFRELLRQLSGLMTEDAATIHDWIGQHYFDGDLARYKPEVLEDEAARKEQG